MSQNTSQRTKAFVITGLGVALLIAVFISPFASSNPDGLERASQDHGFDSAAHKNTLAHRLPFYSIFNEYAVRGVPEGIATPLAGLVGTLVTFGLAWGAGKLLVKGSNTPSSTNSDYSD